MKITESKYTLVVADLQWGDTQPQGGEPGRLENQLTQIVPTGGEVGRCMFLFDTHRDYDRIFQLLLLCRTHNRTALALPVESELHLVCGNSTAESMGKAFPDLKLYRVQGAQRQ
jgi:hypothetical protein